jgi:hypothetical protein
VLKSRRLLERERVERITAEARGASDHAWAGAYGVEVGGRFVQSYTLAPRGDVVRQLDTCFGWTPCGFGRVARADGRTLRVEWEDPLRDVPAELYVVRWGDVRFLVPAQEMDAFCHRVQPSPQPAMEPRFDSYPRSSADLTSCVGPPDVPEPYRSRLERLLQGG